MMGRKCEKGVEKTVTFSHFLSINGLITSPSLMLLTDHVSCNLHVPLKSIFLTDYTVSQPRRPVLNILTMRTQFISQFICNTLHLFDSREGNILITV